MARADSVNMAGERTDFFRLAGPVECQREGDERGLALRRKREEPSRRIILQTMAALGHGPLAAISIALQENTVACPSTGDG